MPHELFSWYETIPFAVLLLAIAVLPLVAEHWWEKNANKAIVTALVSIPPLVVVLLRMPHALGHAMLEYVSFLTLLGSLFVIAGGVHIGGDLEGKPLTNTLTLLLGAVLASVIGTTGASMVLIRFLLRTNRQRQNTKHIPFFFILIVSNCGGLLTPLGDPPLFLGYLRGVPFFWTLRLWPYWLGAIGYLVTVFFLVDKRAYAKEGKRDLLEDSAEKVRLHVQGRSNLVLLVGVVAAALAPPVFREITMLSLTMVSLRFAPKRPRLLNGFSFGPIVEVAILFAGIFITMVPAMELLKIHGGSLGVRTPINFFFVTGVLSSVLDNAPTYLTFLTTAQGLGLANEVVGVPNVTLVAISLGAVFMGANTYVGNGPNFMVKAIAEHSGIKMPGFFTYAGLAIVTLTPIYLAVAWALG